MSINCKAQASRKAGGGPAPSGTGSQPVHRCGACGAMWTGGGGHTCRNVPVNTPRRGGAR